MPPAGVTRRRISKRLDVPSDATAENVAGGVQLAQFGDARVGLVEVVEAVVYPESSGHVRCRSWYYVWLRNRGVTLSLPSISLIISETSWANSAAGTRR